MAGRVEISSEQARVAPSNMTNQSVARSWRLVLTLLKWTVSVALIYWMLRDTNLGEIMASLRAASPRWIVLAASLHVIGFLISAYRWQLLLREQGANASIFYLVKSYFVSIFFSSFLPSTIGGDAVRVYDSWRVGRSKSGALAVIFVDRFLGLLALMLFALVALPFINQLTGRIPLLNLWVLLGIGSMLVVLWIIFVPSRLFDLVGRIRLPFQQKIKHLLGAFLAYQGRRDILLKQMVLSFLLQANVIIHYYFIALALDLPLPLYSFFFIVPLVTVLMMLPISINAIGVRESAFGFFFATFGVTTSESIAFAWIAFGLLLLQGVIGGIVYALRK